MEPTRLSRKEFFELHKKIIEDFVGKKEIDNLEINTLGNPILKGWRFLFS